MPRANLKELNDLIVKAAGGAIAKLDADRKVDRERIAEHVKDSRSLLERLDKDKAEFAGYIEDTRRDIGNVLDHLTESLNGLFDRLIEREGERLKSLEGHLTDMQDETPAIATEPDAKVRKLAIK